MFSWYKHYSPKKNRLYIFGSGWSLNEISKKEWASIEKSGDTMGFNAFYKSIFVRLDYFIIREWAEHYQLMQFVKRYRSVFSSIFNFPEYDKILTEIRNNQCMTKTKYICHIDRKSGPSIIWLLLNKHKENMLGYYTNMYDRATTWPVSETSRNIPHGNSTLFDAINLGYIMGYKEIVLVGVDLYDSAYFYQSKSKSREFDLQRGHTVKDKHKTSSELIDTIPQWNKFLKEKGVVLSVYNPKSLLNQVLPLFKYKKLP